MKRATPDKFLLFYLAYLALAGPRTRDERGDVPGWVMVTVMTVGLALVIFTFAEEPLKALLTRAFDSVN
ncbi:MAG: hypothetical protein JWN68_258 [Nocardioides sp.]|jgi:peptidoglycan/LPS O-acetylase OafA/YrhL|uniref:hypothetical protein n=1 Tax=Nocardioides sp. TaxID=35761 RepID=UPI002611FA1B|nr:hypothetical protein [Nocardioides sp.]MCW2832305.1 hypothetical protein [Nocardioides sp.]